MSFCPSKDIHSVYLDGELPENYKAEYELHISHCEKCRKELEQLKAVSALFKADSDSLNFMDESFQRLQIKMAYSRNIGKVPQKSPFKVISYVASGVAAAAVLALVLPVGLKANKTNAAPVAAQLASISSGSSFSSDSSFDFLSESAFSLFRLSCSCLTFSISVWASTSGRMLFTACAKLLLFLLYLAIIHPT